MTLRADALAAGIAAFIIGMNVALPAEMTVGTVVSILLAPVWLPILRQYRGASFLLVLIVVSVATGIFLTWSRDGANAHDTHLLTSNSLLLLGVGLNVGALLWSRSVISAPTMAIVFGAGMLLGSVFMSPTDNDWKFTFATPVTVLLLAIASRRSSAGLGILILLALIATSFATDSRSSATILGVALLIALAQKLPMPARGYRSAVSIIALIAGGIFIAFIATEQLILAGAFGPDTMLRTQAQLSRGIPIMVSGRPEMGAALALLTDHPAGVGSGTIPSADNILSAKTGMWAIGYDPDNAYVDRYMFGNGFEVHSMIGDLWLRYGIPGLLLTLSILVLTILWMLRRLQRSAASALFLFLALRTIWNLLFSPMYSSSLMLVLFLAILLPHVTEPKPSEPRLPVLSEPSSRGGRTRRNDALPPAGLTLA